MNKLFSIAGSARVFLDEVRTELKKSVWPTWPELSESTVVIIISVIILGIFVGISDLILKFIIEVLVGIR